MKRIPPPPPTAGNQHDDGVASAALLINPTTARADSKDRVVVSVAVLPDPGKPAPI